VRTLTATLLACALTFGLTGCPEDDPPVTPTADADASADTTTDTGGDQGTPDAAPDGTPDATPDATSTATCASYCATITASCTGTEAQYDSENQCLTVCNEWAGWDAGNDGDQSGNTIACRLYHANAAASTMPDAAATHCPHAGPSGGNVCGTWCENYCDLSARNCADSNAIYASEAECTATCAGLTDTAPPNITDGNSVQCRIYHLQVAGSDPPDSAGIHCPHGAEDGGGVCVDPDPTCANYCSSITSACTGDNAQYASEQACLDYCNTHGALPVGDAGAQSGNSIACRIYHAGVAATGEDAAAIHCAHAGPSGGDVCGTWCTNYCHLAQTNCTGGNELFANVDDCTVACSAFEEDGAANAVDGDSVQCRIYHLGVAGDAGSGGPETHCPHGAVDGGGVCVQPEPSCQLYCDRVMANCADDNAQYASAQQCLDHCNTFAAWELGTSIDETSGNTVSCRIYHATVAAGDPATHCSHAGPSGGDVCGSWCTNYCDLATKNCTGGDELYANSDACATACANFAETGSANDVDGDSVQCRVYHLGVAGDAASGGPGTHCPHGAEDGGGVCVQAQGNPGDCATYCAAVTANCTGDNAQYGGEAGCLSYCNSIANFELGTDTDTTGNTVGCRTYHANAAATEPAVHCDHAGPTGGNLCGTWCENYCHLADQVCTGGDAITFGTDCATDCAAYPTTGDVGAGDNNSVQCRLYHLGLAAQDPGLHCPHGAPDGGGVCIDSGATPTYTADVQPILNAKCAGCHTGGSSGQHNIGNTYSDANKSVINSAACGSATTVGECAIIRIKDGSMPLAGNCTGDPVTDAGNASCLTQAEQDTIQDWVDAGMPQ